MLRATLGFILFLLLLFLLLSGHGGVHREAEPLGLPFLGEIPLDLSVRVAADSGVPIAGGDGPVAQSYAALAEGLVRGGMA